VDKSHVQQRITTVAHSKYSPAQILKLWKEFYSKTRSITDQQEIIDSAELIQEDHTFQQSYNHRKIIQNTRPHPIGKQQ
jgi:hypothetical protein